MEISCPKCKIGKMAHNGFHLGKQTYKCNNNACRYSTTDLNKIPITDYDKAMALKFHSYLSFRTIATLIGTSVNSVQKWLEYPDEKWEKIFENISNRDIIEYLKVKKEKCPELFNRDNKMGEQMYQYYCVLTKKQPLPNPHKKVEQKKKRRWGKYLIGI